MNGETTEIFEKDGKFGLVRGKDVLIEPCHESIDSFTGGYAMVDGTFFTDENGRIFRNRKSNGDRVLELMPGGFAKVLTVRNETGYRDWITNEIWSIEPDEITKVGFIRLIRIKDLYYLRTCGKFINVAFKKEDLQIKTNGNIFQKRNALNKQEIIFIHNTLPDKIFIFIGYNQDLSKRLLPYYGEKYYWSYIKDSDRPVMTKERILPVDTEEYRRHIEELKQAEQDIQNVIRMKRLTQMGKNWLAE